MDRKPQRVAGKSKTKRQITYTDVSFDKDGWADVQDFLPPDYELCHLKTKNKIYKGWFTGISWDGLHVPENIVVTHWKRYVDYNL